MVVCEAHDWTVPVQVLQLQPTSAEQAVDVVFALHGVTVPVHDVAPVDQEQARFALHAVEFVKAVHDVETPLHV